MARWPAEDALAALKNAGDNDVDPSYRAAILDACELHHAIYETVTLIEKSYIAINKSTRARLPLSAETISYFVYHRIRHLNRDGLDEGMFNKEWWWNTLKATVNLVLDLAVIGSIWRLFSDSLEARACVGSINAIMCGYLMNWKDRALLMTIINFYQCRILVISIINQK